ncbi:hypothetical protein CKAN_02708900 [Cinnamomum micranthum f. kanehirae]|uniref:Uncharacterized protein n=1 Tax=Cinnamomum micranthum f. kanehirae TaxID=337451 RepID=A0A3S3RA29_9MAGN|nr:hypothetical protein CKAN_02708900 [Cinnamomum micranthum f. kanehirae]
MQVPAMVVQPRRTNLVWVLSKPQALIFHQAVVGHLRFIEHIGSEKFHALHFEEVVSKWNINTLIFWYMASKQDSRFDSEDLVIFKLQEMASECMRKGDEHGVGGGRLFGGKLFSLLLCRRKKKEGML